MGAPHISFVLLLIFSPTAAPLPHCDGDGREDGVRTVKASELTREQQMCGRPMAVGSRRNVGGEDAVEGQWPWQGSLLRDGTHICGVSLVAPQWVLTAAHCFQRSLDPRLYAVLLGVQELSGPWGQNRTVPLDRLLPHPAYAGEATSGDIALAQLAWPVTYGATIAPVCLPGPKLNFPAGTQCVATGWGDIGEGEDLPSPRRLQEVAVPLMAQAQCRRLYGTEMGAGRPPRRVRDDMICAGYPQGLRDTCKRPIAPHMSLPPTPERPIRPHSRSRLQRPTAPHKLWGREPRCVAAPPGSMGLPHGHLYDPQRPGSSFRQCFQLMGLLGRGSYGTVFKVRSLVDGRLYALKRSARPFRGPTERQRSLLEAHRHRAVGRSPHCVQLWAAWEERGVLYLQSQLCSEGSLHHHRHHHRHGGPLWGWRLSAYLWDLLGALRHLHGRRMSHGDVRPSNAMLDGGRCLLGDFGWCGEEGGSGRYAAPEAAEAMAEATTAEGDVFSLGLTVAEVALGERADDGETWTELRGGRLPHALRAALPPELLPLLAAMLDPDPQRRPTAEALLQSAPMRRVGRWRPLLRLLDVGLRRGAELLQSCRAALRRMWGALWGRAMGQSTPPHTPLLPHIDPWDDEEEEEDSEALWGRSPPGSPTAFRPTASTPQHRGSPPSTPEGSPTAMGRLRRTLTFEEDSEPHSAAP